MQLVFEFGARKAGPVIAAIRQVLGETACAASVWTESKSVHAHADETLERIASRLEEGTTGSFVAYPRLENVRYVLVTAPSLDPPRSLYMGTVEYTSRDYEQVWDLLLGVPELTIICLGFEEGVELDDLHLDVNTFPWDQWPLVVGAVRTAGCGGGTWVIKNGPEMRWFTEVPQGGGRENGPA